MGAVNMEHTRNMVKSDETVYTKPHSRWGNVMCFTNGPNTLKRSFNDVWTVPIV